MRQTVNEKSVKTLFNSLLSLIDFLGGVLEEHHGAERLHFFFLAGQAPGSFLVHFGSILEFPWSTIGDMLVVI